MEDDAYLSAASRAWRLAPRGWQRFGETAFLVLWLLFWLAGEVAVTAVLGFGTVALVRGEPPGVDHLPLELGPALGVGAFLLVWLAFWTIGGIAAGHQLLRLLWAEDRLAVAGGDLLVERRAGPFRSRRQLAGNELVRIAALPITTLLVAETTTATVALSDLGTPDQRRRLAATLSGVLGLDPRETSGLAGAVPLGWEAVVSASGEQLVVRDRRTRRAQAMAAATVAATATAVVVALLAVAWPDPVAPAPAALAIAVAVLAGGGAVWLARGRSEWVVAPGRLTLRRRFGERTRTLLEGRGLELVEHTDSDDDHWYELRALGASGSSRRVVQVLNDPIPSRQLGRWLAHRSGLPLAGDRGRRGDGDL